MRSKSYDNIQNKSNLNLINKASYLFTRAIMWQNLLQVDNTIYYPIEYVSLTQTNQRVIKFDVLRTRGLLLDQELKICLEKLLTFFVQENNIIYKQGIHEIAAPFIVLLKAGLSLSTIYQMFNKFIKRYMTNFFDDDYHGIQCILQAFTILLKYHDMKIYNNLMQYEFSSELYAIPWFITLFIHKSDFKIAQMIIENTMLINDKYFIFSFNIAVLIFHKDEILKRKSDSLPQFITKIYLNDENCYFEILKIALKIHTYTPKSYWAQLNNINLFNHHVKPIFQESKNRLLEIISISPQEVQEMIKQHTLITEKWEIQDINHPQVQKLQEVFKKQTYKPQQPVLIFYDLEDQLKLKISENSLIHIINLSTTPMEKILKQLFNFKMTNTLWICFIGNELFQFEPIFQALCQENTRFICKCNGDSFFQIFAEKQ